MGENYMIRIIKKNFLNGVIIVLIASIIMPFLLASLYTLPSVDDFTNVNSVTEHLSDSNWFTAASKATITTYNKWQGTYFGLILIYFIAPLKHFGVAGIRVFSLLNGALFFTALFMFVKAIFTYILADNKWGHILFTYLLFVYGCVNTTASSEIFFWYTGACVYTMPLSCALLGCASMLTLLGTKKNKYFICALLLGFLASGGSLQITAFACFSYLLIAAISWFSKSKEKYKFLIAFAITFLGALINVLAPGNYNRHDLTNQTGIQILPAISNTLSNVTIEFIKVMTKTFLPFALVLLFIIGCRITEKMKFNFPFPPLVFLVSFGGVCLTSFPVHLGYSSAGMPERCLFTLYIMIVISLFVCVFYATGWLTHNYHTRLSNEQITILTIMLVMMFLLNSNNKILSIPSVQCAYQLSTGQLQKDSDEWLSVLDEINYSEELNVAIERTPFGQTSVLKNPGITENPKNWINKEIAEFYNKDSVKIMWVQ